MVRFHICFFFSNRFSFRSRLGKGSVSLLIIRSWNMENYRKPCCLLLSERAMIRHNSITGRKNSPMRIAHTIMQIRIKFKTNIYLQDGPCSVESPFTFFVKIMRIINKLKPKIYFWNWPLFSGLPLQLFLWIKEGSIPKIYFGLALASYS